MLPLNLNIAKFLSSPKNYAAPTTPRLSMPVMISPGISRAREKFAKP